MTNEEFGKMVYQHCHVAEVRNKILESARMRQSMSEAEAGFVAAIRNNDYKSGADEGFLRALATLDAEGAALDELEHRHEQHDAWLSPSGTRSETGDGTGVV